ncbi:MAG: methoxymalonyl-ACP biosynthesis protein FkbH [Caulobacteraceae bacterium]|nr:methoxymalonyl-ACP biosynthesis protein FkbH [Caulobacteraceae bacterium]
MSVMVDFAWRAPAGGDWLERWTALDAQVRSGLTPQTVDEAGLELRCLARRRLDDRQQLKLEKLSVRLAATPSTPANFRRFRLGVLAARTWDLMTGPIAAAGAARGLLIQVIHAGYDEIDAFAHGASDALAGQDLDAVLVALDAASFAPQTDLLDQAAEDAAFEARVAKFASLAQAVRETAGCVPILATLPDGEVRVSGADLGVTGSRVRLIARLNIVLGEGARRGDWILWDQAELAQWLGHVRWLDPAGRRLAKTPFAGVLAPLVADHLCALLSAVVGKAGRVAVVDLDNTLWGGVIGDDGLEGIRLGQNSAEGEAYLAFQAYLLDLRARGVVLAVCSKNSEAVAREPFRSHPDMLLREEHFAVFQANWLDKASNIQAIAQSLNLGPESIVLLDDNPAEREQVRQALPLVNVPEIGDDPALFELLVRRSGAFEHLSLTREDIERASAYGAEARRALVRTEIGDYDAYLASLDMTMTIAPFDELGLPRIVQLMAKSNQFNLTTRRYNDEAIRRMIADETVLGWQVRLDDAFGGHGVIGALIVRMQAREWLVESWIQSCRILRRGVEEAIMNTLMAHARLAGVNRIVGEFIPTPRNAMVADFYERLGFIAVPSANEIRRFVGNPAEFEAFKSFIAINMDRPTGRPDPADGLEASTP